MASTVPAWLQSFINGPLFDSKYWRISNPAARASNEGGIDIPGSGGEAITALADGVIVGAGNFWHSSNLYTPGSGAPGYGVVTTRVTSPGGLQNDLYYQHLQLNPNIQYCNQGSGPCTGQVVHKGDVLGWIVPSVGETEIGINANWGGVWGSSHPSNSMGWIDPEPFMRAVVAGGALPVQGAGVSDCPVYCLGFNFKNPLDPNATKQCLPDFPGCSGCCGNPNIIGANSDPNNINGAVQAAGIGQLGSFFTGLSQPSTWIRVGAVGLGIIIIAIAVWKMI